MARILIADDHAVARRGIKEILLEAFPSAEITLTNDAEELIKMVIKQEWDLVISDISMPGRSGLDALHDLKKNFPDLAVLILTIHPEEEYAVRAIREGAAGYLNKDEAVEEELIKAVDIILRGRKYITPSVAERLANEVTHKHNKEPHEMLSNKEFHIFKLIAQGRSTGEIAERLSLSVNTIGTFRGRILAKMQMKTNAEIISYAIRNNLA